MARIWGRKQSRFVTVAGEAFLLLQVFSSAVLVPSYVKKKQRNPWLFILCTFRNVSRHCKINHTSNLTETAMTTFFHVATSCWNLDPVPTTIAMLPESPRVLAPIWKYGPLTSSVPFFTGHRVQFNEIKHDSDAWIFRSLSLSIPSPSIQH